MGNQIRTNQERVRDIAKRMNLSEDEVFNALIGIGYNTCIESCLVERGMKKTYRAGENNEVWKNLATRIGGSIIAIELDERLK